jgi:hypothetical protein
VDAPASLIGQVLEILGRDAEEDEARTAEVCVTAAARALEEMVEARRFAREHAPELLAIDALTTYAFEHASSRSADDLGTLSARGVKMLGHLVTQRV